MDFRGSFVADAQPSELVKPSDGAFDDPAIFSEPTAVAGVSLGNHRLDAERPKHFGMSAGMVGPVSEKALGPFPRPAHLATDCWDSLYERQELSNVMTVCRAEEAGKGNAFGLREDVVLRAHFSSVRRVGTGLLPPKTARTEELSATALDQSSLLASWSLASNVSWSAFQTPVQCQSLSRVQQAVPEPQPISLGSAIQGMPVFRTKRMPVRALRLSRGFRPGYRNRLRFGVGSRGSISVHNLSSTKTFAMCPPVKGSHGFSSTSSIHLGHF